MDLKHKLFPYPVLAPFMDDYKDNTFDNSAGIKHIGKEIEFEFKCKVNNKQLCELINQDKASYVFHIECAPTSYRQIVTTKENMVSHKIAAGKLVGKVQICTFIIALQDIDAYQNNDFADDYDGILFTIERGNILAIGNQFNVLIDKEKDELGKIPSVFSILRKINPNEKELSVDIDNNKVKIWLPEKEYYNYQRIANVPALQPSLHGMIVLPVLVHIFEQMKQGGIDDYEEHRWFKSIKKSLEMQHIKLNAESIQREGSLKLAQLVLEMPVARALDGLVSGNMGEGEY